MKNQILQGGVAITLVLLLWNFALLFPNKQSIDSSHHEIPSSLVHKANSLFTLIVHQEDQKKKSNIFQFVEELLFSRIAVILPMSDFANVTFANVFGRFANAMSRFANVLLVTSPTPNI